MKQCLSLVLLLILMVPVRAEVQGQNDPRFQDAVEHWLSGDDATALAEIAVLAQMGMPAAQLFLGQIETQTWLHDHVTGTLDRKERIALLRNPQGLSGRSWLIAAAESIPRAQMILDSRQPVDGVALGQNLAEIGETWLALDQIMRVVNASGDWVGAVQLALHPDLVKYTSGFAQTVVLRLPDYAQIGAVDVNDPRLPDITDALGTVPSFDLPGKLMWFGPDDLQLTFQDPAQLREAGAILIEDARIQPLIELIRDACPADPESAIAIIQFSGPREPMFDVLFSPVPSIISNERYLTSPRFAADVKRKLSFVRPRLEFMERLNPCAHAFAVSR